MLIQDLDLIANLAQVDDEAKDFLLQLEIQVRPQLYKFALRKGLVLSGAPVMLVKCEKCGKATSEPVLCRKCATKVSDSRHAKIPFQIKEAKNNRAKVIATRKATSIPDAYRQLGVIAYQLKATIFMKNNNTNEMWYQTKDGKRKYFLRWVKPNVKLHSTNQKQ